MGLTVTCPEDILMQELPKPLHNHQYLPGAHSHANFVRNVIPRTRRFFARHLGGGLNHRDHLPRGCLPLRRPQDFRIAHFLVGIGSAAAGVGVLFVDHEGGSVVGGEGKAREVAEAPLIVVTPPAEANRRCEWWFGAGGAALQMKAR